MPGTGLPSGALIETGSPMAERSGGCGTGGVGGVGGGAEPLGGGRGAHAGSPDDGFGIQPVAAVDDTVGGAFGDGLSELHFDADTFQRALRAVGEIPDKV